MEREFICDNLSVNSAGHLCFAGLDVVDIAKKYGTPLYLLDEERIRERCRTFKDAIHTCFGENAFIAYASKASSFKEIYRIIKSENMYVDVVSCGEIYTAKAAGFPLENTLFHSNNKTDDDIKYAMDNGVGYFVVDSEEELLAIQREAEKRKAVQKVLLRITPGIDSHTFAAVQTGKIDSKFGSAIETGQAKKITVTALKQKNIKLSGYHCHIGSQIFNPDVFIRAAIIMVSFIADIKNALGYETEILDMGGGFGVRYLPSDPVVDIKQTVINIGNEIKNLCDTLGVKLPAIIFEPGRSIIADAGMTLYTVGTLKKIPDFINYVSVDGGMTDNVRHAMYKANYTLVAANKINEPCSIKASVAGRCCESGDIIEENVPLPANIKRGDIIACLTTGAYNYSMASNYNRIPRPPIVMLKDGESRVVVKRETFYDICNLDV
ncbi:MAG: diaminopimelate decarboxylase [Clostridia bacterium]|nr:diaminopimelate decarboxylase [Clostridia bacterium]